MASEDLTLDPSDRKLLERLAQRIVELHLEVPAILALESGRPLSLLAGQTMLFLEPLAQALFPLTDYRRYAALIERRDVLEAFTRMIEARVEVVRPTRRPASGSPGS
jgi:hypothetical protein